MGFLRAGDPAGRGVEKDPVPRLGRLDADAYWEVGFAGALWSKEGHVFGLVEGHADALLGDEVPAAEGCWSKLNSSRSLGAGNIEALIRVPLGGFALCRLLGRGMRPPPEAQAPG